MGNKVCWEWVGAKYANGYGMFFRDGRHVGAHRASYEMWRGPIPAGMTIDHLCKNKPCVNPMHLEVVTRAENTSRAQRGQPSARTHCKNGHPYNEENTIWVVTKSGRRERHCRACNLAWKTRLRRAMHELKKEDGKCQP